MRSRAGNALTIDYFPRWPRALRCGLRIDGAERETKLVSMAKLADEGTKICKRLFSSIRSLSWAMSRAFPNQALEVAFIKYIAEEIRCASSLAPMRSKNCRFFPILALDDYDQIILCRNSSFELSKVLMSTSCSPRPNCRGGSIAGL